MSKRIKWFVISGILVIAGALVIPEAYAYLTKRNYESEVVSAEDIPDDYKVATFAGGCFWCMEPPFEKLKGVKEVVSGYTGGETENPTYEEVSAGGTGHLEAVQVYFDPDVITYEQLLDVFWRQINPTDDGGQFVDRGYQYTTAIFYNSEKQQKLAKQSKQEMAESGRFEGEIVTPISPAEEFYRAEEYHQDYYKKNELRYKFYRGNSGRDDYLEETWGEDRKLDLPEKESQ
ncbi:peptide-methionine (S)-S-oxide reductase MsrA [Halobacillus amylolyticus]|uniref:Peptide methionine sulfoxide reductase MsrA n=1 Tax=Halobacillus amylolyticus TaxID=2932259 RepID=A0ABY4HFS6_9BACI|nr:peptide-methionine (S)-S-oxide reductase MsrA [Halobacillus amylolyticus]UOR13381.1 peptide-methionine (S)-S-oxide reductase MsrA [Halobacillus amylolyticus]